ncbi:hypothetical protein ACU686_35895 [Yinghuangia aomiensis]
MPSRDAAEEVPRRSSAADRSVSWCRTASGTGVGDGAAERGRVGDVDLHRVGALGLGSAAAPCAVRDVPVGVVARRRGAGGRPGRPTAPRWHRLQEDAHMGWSFGVVVLGQVGTGLGPNGGRDADAGSWPHRNSGDIGRDEVVVEGGGDRRASRARRR